jgi:hypothetical protein
MQHNGNMSNLCELKECGFLSGVLHSYARLKDMLLNSEIMCFYGAGGRVVGSGTMLQAGRSRVQLLTRSFFFNLPNPSTITTAMGSTRPLTEINIRDLPGVTRVRRVKQSHRRL